MRAKLRDLFTAGNHAYVLGSTSCNVEAAKRYTVLAPEGVTITRQLVKHWRTLYAADTTPAKAMRALKEARTLKTPEPLGKGGRFKPSKVYDTIVVMPDLHAPYHHRHALAFMTAVRDKYKPDLVINLGDELDKHAMSFHDSDPDLMSAGDELAASLPVMAELNKIFPRMLLCDSNHGSMAFRKAKAHGFAAAYIKSYREVMFPEGGGRHWHWAENWRVRTALGDVVFKHQPSGPALSDAAHNSCNLMVGHHHGKFTIEYGASSARLYWAAYSGCLIDKDSLAFAYGKHTMYKPIIGCTVILKGVPVLIPMLMDKDGNWVGEL